jgi:hypothetical protein
VPFTLVRAAHPQGPRASPPRPPRAPVAGAGIRWPLPLTPLPARRLRSCRGRGWCRDGRCGGRRCGRCDWCTRLPLGLGGRSGCAPQSLQGRVHLPKDILLAFDRGLGRGGWPRWRGSRRGWQWRWRRWWGRRLGGNDLWRWKGGRAGLRRRRLQPKPHRLPGLCKRLLDKALRLFWGDRAARGRCHRFCLLGLLPMSEEKGYRRKRSQNENPADHSHHVAPNYRMVVASCQHLVIQGPAKGAPGRLDRHPAARERGERRVGMMAARNPDAFRSR